MFTSLCGGLDENGLHRPIESGTVWMGGLFGIEVALLEEVLQGADFEILDAQVRPSVSLFSCCLLIWM